MRRKETLIWEEMLNAVCCSQGSEWNFGPTERFYGGHRHMSCVAKVNNAFLWCPLRHNRLTEPSYYDRHRVRVEGNKRQTMAAHQRTGERATGQTTSPSLVRWRANRWEHSLAVILHTEGHEPGHKASTSVKKNTSKLRLFCSYKSNNRPGHATQ